MICIRTVNKFCNGDISEIENYSEAVADKECWHCHHRMEIQPDGVRLKRKWMIEHGIYYDVDPFMLIFLKESDHRKLHSTGHQVSAKVREVSRELMKKMSHDNFRGKRHTAESREKMHLCHAGRKLVMIDGRRHYVKPV